MRALAAVDRRVAGAVGVPVRAAGPTVGGRVPGATIARRAVLGPPGAHVRPGAVSVPPVTGAPETTDETTGVMTGETTGVMTEADAMTGHAAGTIAGAAAQPAVVTIAGQVGPATIARAPIARARIGRAPIGIAMTADRATAIPTERDDRTGREVAARSRRARVARWCAARTAR